MKGTQPESMQNYIQTTQQDHNMQDLKSENSKFREKKRLLELTHIEPDCGETHLLSNQVGRQLSSQVYKTRVGWKASHAQLYLYKNSDSET